jgi:predicted DNA-binding mobile mystery protein A
MDVSYQRLATRQLSEALARYATAAVTPRPRNGWIAAIRDTLDMTVRQFATRLGVTPSSALRLEQREREDTISLGALRRAADALDCDLVYAVVPRLAPSSKNTDNLIQDLIEARAREVATAEIGRVAHTMALEDQTVDAADLQTQIAERAAVIAESPRRLWDAENARPATRPPTTGRGRRG